MKEIKKIADFIEKETDGVNNYIKYACKVKGVDEVLFNTLLEIIPQELKHIELLHDTAIKELDKAKSSLKSQDKEIPDYMLELWEESHNNYIEHLSLLKYKFELLKR